MEYSHHQEVMSHEVPQIIKEREEEVRNTGYSYTYIYAHAHTHPHTYTQPNPQLAKREKVRGA